PGIGPLHAFLARSGRAKVIAVTDCEALDAAMTATRLEGIIPALESAHALAVLDRMKFGRDETVVINVSGRGDKDMNTNLQALHRE
ncbi:MAG: tryptophan synthase subunit beta, partial [Duncaniella sp.]|nr:tryptophan synthase subunit beta [Duncaniella sp.]